MITARVNTVDQFDELTAAFERHVIFALDEAAAEARAVAEKEANSPKPIAHFETIPAHSIGTGYASGVKAGPLTRIFEKGSLGRHHGVLKRARKPDWEVNRGTNPYTARRHDPASGGVAPRHALQSARRAGRAMLLRRLHRT